MKEAEDNALEMFTPGAHSPNEVDLETSKESNSISISPDKIITPSMKFYDLKMNNTKNCTIEELGINASKLEKVLAQYNSQLPQNLLSFICNSQTISDISYNYNDTRYF